MGCCQDDEDDNLNWVEYLVILILIGILVLGMLRMSGKI